MGFLEETKVWLLVSKDCGYTTNESHEKFCLQYDEPGAKISKLCENRKTF